MRRRKLRRKCKRSKFTPINVIKIKAKTFTSLSSIFNLHDSTEKEIVEGRSYFVLYRKRGA